MIGYVVLTVITVAVALSAVPALDYVNVGTMVSLEAAILAFVLMAVTQFMATRPKFVEAMFGGLDKLYVAHRRLGYTVLGLILIHYFNTPNFRGLFIDRQLNEFAREFGLYAFYALCALIVFSVFKWIPLIRFQIPYHLWYFSHRFIGFAFVALAVHQHWIKKPPEFTGSTIAFTLDAFSLLGTASFAYTQAPALFKKRQYRVVSVERLPSATILTVKPLSRPIKLRRGQFAILHARRGGLGEPHPFTVADVAVDGLLKFAVKPSGDFTRRLREVISPGDTLRLEGGYGRFDFRRGNAKQVWIAGGIGVTPFMSMLPDVKNSPGVDVTMVYCVRDRNEALDLDAFTRASEQLANFRFMLHVSGDSGRLDAAKLAAMTGIEDKSADVFFCGPAALRKALVNGLAKLGKRPRRVWFEHFEFR